MIVDNTFIWLLFFFVFACHFILGADDNGTTTSWGGGANKKTEQPTYRATAANLHTLMELHSFMFVFVGSSSWCIHCYGILFEFEKACRAFNGTQAKNIQCACVDVDEEDFLAFITADEGLPTLFVYDNGFRFDFDGIRDADVMFKWLNYRLENSVRLVESRAELEALQSQRYFLVVLNKAGDSRTKEVFQQSCGDYQYAYVEVEVPDQNKEPPLESSGIYAFSNVTNRWSRFSPDPSRDLGGQHEDFVAFCDRTQLPRVVEYDPLDGFLYAGGAFSELVLLFDNFRSYPKITLAKFKAELLKLFDNDEDISISSYPLAILVDPIERSYIASEFAVAPGDNYTVWLFDAMSSERLRVTRSLPSPKGVLPEDASKQLRAFLQGTTASDYPALVTAPFPHGKSTRHLDRLVRRISSTDLDELVFRSGRVEWLLLLIDSAPCGFCRIALQRVVQATEAVKKMMDYTSAPLLKAYVLDGSTDDHEDLPMVNGFPSLFLYAPSSQEGQKEYPRESPDPMADDLAVWLMRRIGTGEGAPDERAVPRRSDRKIRITEIQIR